MKYLLIVFVGIIVFEIIEHILLPLFWMIRHRSRPSAYGPSGMIGKKCVVKHWDGGRGKVWINGELWNAVGKAPLTPGEEVVIRELQGLTVRVSPPDTLPDSH